MGQKTLQIIFVCLCIIETIASDIGLCNGTSQMKINSTYNISVEDKCVLCDRDDNVKCDKGGDYDEFFDTSVHQISSYISIQSNISKKPFCYFCISHYNASLNEFILDDTVIVMYNNKIKIGRWETELVEPKRKRYKVTTNPGMSFYDIHLFIKMLSYR